jgi:hypothetical protein
LGQIANGAHSFVTTYSYWQRRYEQICILFTMAQLKFEAQDVDILFGQWRYERSAILATAL